MYGVIRIVPSCFIFWNSNMIFFSKKLSYCKLSYFFFIVKLKKYLEIMVILQIVIFWQFQNNCHIKDCQIWKIFKKIVIFRCHIWKYDNLLYYKFKRRKIRDFFKLEQSWWQVHIVIYLKYSKYLSYCKLSYFENFENFCHIKIII